LAKYCCSRQLATILCYFAQYSLIIYSPICVLVFHKNLSLGRDNILEFVKSESAQNFDLQTTFSQWPSYSKCNNLLFEHIFVRFLLHETMELSCVYELSTIATNSINGVHIRTCSIAVKYIIYHIYNILYCNIELYTCLSYYSISQLENLQILNVSGNKLSDGLPDDMFKPLQSLTELDISNCGLRTLLKR